MTAEDPKDGSYRPLLENILKTVRSVDRNVEEILDRLTDHFADLDYRQDWGSHGYDYGTVHDEDPC